MKKEFITALLGVSLIISVFLNFKFYNALDIYRNKEYQINSSLRGNISALTTILFDSKANRSEQFSIPISEKIYILAYYSSYRKNVDLLNALSKLDYIFKNQPVENIVNNKNKLQIRKFLEDISQNPDDKNASQGLFQLLSKIQNNDNKSGP